MRALLPWKIGPAEFGFSTVSKTIKVLIFVLSSENGGLKQIIHEKEVEKFQKIKVFFLMNIDPWQPYLR